MIFHLIRHTKRITDTTDHTKHIREEYNHIRRKYKHVKKKYKRRNIETCEEKIQLYEEKYKYMRKKYSEKVNIQTYEEIMQNIGGKIQTYEGKKKL